MLSGDQPDMTFKGKVYCFEDVFYCEICGAPDSNNRILGQRMNMRQALRTSRLQGISTTIKRCFS